MFTILIKISNSEFVCMEAAMESKNGWIKEEIFVDFKIG